MQSLLPYLTNELAKRIGISYVGICRIIAYAQFKPVLSKGCRTNERCYFRFFKHLINRYCAKTPSLANRT